MCVCVCACVCVCMCVCTPEQCSDNGALVVFVKHQGEENRPYLAVPTNVIAVHLTMGGRKRVQYNDIMVTIKSAKVMVITHGNRLA